MSPLRFDPIRSIALWTLLGGLGIATGCSSLPSAPLGPLGAVAGKSESSGATDSSAAGLCSVEFHSGSKRTKSVEVPVTPNTRVQEVLEASKANRRYRNPEIVVVRPTRHPSEPHLKLKCRYDSKERRVAWDSDYSILPGDRVLVREGKGSSVEDVIGSMVGPVMSGK